MGLPLILKTKMNKKTFYGIGDVVVDDFIFLKDANVHCDVDSANCRISMKWGTKIPFEKVIKVAAVGNSINACFSAHRLGLDSYPITNIGDDTPGKHCLSAMKNENLNTSFVKVNKDKVTNQHFVLSFGAERTILVNHEEYEYKVPDLGTPDVIYLSSLAENSIPYHDALMDYLDNTPNTLLSFQPGTFQMSLGYEKLKRVYKRADLFFCNKEEANRILNANHQDMVSILSGMHDLGPKIVIITDGVNGAYTYDGKEMLFAPVYPDPSPPVERTGAGDSFSSAFTSFITLGMSVQDALLRAPINSMSVVQYVGAREGLLSVDQIDVFLKNAPTDYQINKLSI